MGSIRKRPFWKEEEKEEKRWQKKMIVFNLIVSKSVSFKVGRISLIWKHII